jgi:hypothetical protein
MDAEHEKSRGFTRPKGWWISWFLVSCIIPLSILVALDNSVTTWIRILATIFGLASIVLAAKLLLRIARSWRDWMV